MRPAEDLEPLQRMDPLTKGSLFHAIQTEFYRRLKADGKLPVTPAGLTDALQVLDRSVEEVAAAEHEQLAPAIERVWKDEIGAMRRDLRLWVDQIAHAEQGWVPIKFEWAFGYQDGGALAVGRDPSSRREPVTIDGRFQLHGSIDLIEEHRQTRQLRVTDHKTGKNRSSRGSFIGGGAQLQPIIYSLAVEEATGCTVEGGRFSYCTTPGGFTDHAVPINERTRRMGIEVLEIIDRAVELGMLPPAPADRACGMCDFLTVCGPDRERAARKKAPHQIADLLELRGRP